MTTYSKEFKEEAIRLSDEVGNKKAAAQLGILYYTLADWRNRTKTMCRVLKISESGYYRWLKNRAKPTARALLSVKIQAILDEHPDNDNYGVDRICTALEQRCVRVSRRTVYKRDINEHLDPLIVGKAISKLALE